MSLEAKIEANTAAILKLAAILESKQAVVSGSDTVQVPVVAQFATAVTPVVAPAAVVEMPALPSFVAPVVTPAPTNVAPFTDSKGLIEYVMAAYKQMGAEKGAKIQNVLVSLSYQNINDVKPEHYGALFAGVEALKA